MSFYLANGNAFGFEWLVLHNGRGYRCGYIKIPLGHPWYGKHYDELHVDVHGGLTYSRDYLAGYNKNQEKDWWWLGFDCGHVGDEPDPELPGANIGKYGPFNIMSELLEFSDIACSKPRNLESGVRTQEYVEDECRKLCEQALKATE